MSNTEPFIIIATLPDDLKKNKGDLLEDLAGHLLKAQDYKIDKNIRKTGMEVDLECQHNTIKGQRVLVECKGYGSDKTIDSTIVKSLFGARQLGGYSNAWLIATCRIGKEAKGIIKQIEGGGDSDKYAFYTPESLIGALISAKVIASAKDAKKAITDIVPDEKRIGNATLFLSKYGYYWCYDYLKGGEPSGVIFVTNNDKPEIVYEKELLDNLSRLDSEVSNLDHLIALELLAASNEQVIISDYKSLRLNPIYEKEIDDMCIKITHPKVDRVGLRDIFVFPDLKVSDEDNKKTKPSLPIIKDCSKKILILGGDLSGKTSLGRMAQLMLDTNGQVALFISAREIKNHKKDAFEKLLKKKFSEQYGDRQIKTEMFETILKDEKAIVSIIIDDFEEIGIKSLDRRLEFVTYLKRTFDSLIVLASSAMELEVSAEARTKTMFSGFEYYRILQLGHVKRDELINKWVNLDDNDELTDNEILSIKDNFTEKINVAVGSNFIPTYPFYTLTMIHLIEDGGNVRTHGSSYASLYNYFITHALLSTGVDPEDIDFYLNYLANVAFEMYAKRKTTFGASELRSYYAGYCTEMALNRGFDFTHRTLVEAKILTLSDAGYSFSLNYCRYYFVAKYISDNINSSQIKKEVTDIVDALNKNENANIIVFLIHHSKDKTIIDTILDKAKTQFNGIEQHTFSLPELENTNSLVKDEMRISISGDSPSENRKKSLEIKDKKEKKDDEDVDVLNIFGQVNLAFRTMDVLGKISSNYFGSLDAKIKDDLLSQLYALGLRAFRAFIDSLEVYTEALRQDLDQLIEEKGIKSDSDKNNLIDEIIYQFVHLISFGFVSQISNNLSSKNLRLVLDAILSRQDTPVAKLIDVVVRLNFPEELKNNKKEILSLHDSLEKNHLTRDLLRFFVINHMYNFHVDFAEKQSICAKMNINYQKVLENTGK